MNLSAKTRTYIYSILLAVQPLAIAYGFISHDMSILWINVIASVLGGGLSLTNINPDQPKQDAASQAPNPTVVLSPEIPVHEGIPAPVEVSVPPVEVSAVPVNGQ